MLALVLAAVHVVTADRVAWNPKVLEVAPGDTVVWKNTDLVPHNARQDQRAFWSSDIQPGKTFRWKAKKKGTYPYKCTLHPVMTGTVVVR